MTDELEWVWKEVAGNESNVVSQHLPKGSKEITVGRITRTISSTIFRAVCPFRTNFYANISLYSSLRYVQTQSFHVTRHENSEGWWKLGFHPYFDILHKRDSKVVSSTRQPHFTSKEIPWHSFLLEVEWTQELQNAGRRNRSLEYFQGPYRKSNPEPPVVLRYVIQCFFWNLLHYDSVLCLSSPVAILIFLFCVKILSLILV